MKIAVWYNLPSGGGKRALSYHVRGLLERGHAVEAWRPPVPNDAFSSLSSLIHEHVVPFAVLPEGTTYLQKIYRHIVRPRRLIAAAKQHSEACAREIDAGGFDVLFANTDLWFSMPFIGRYSELPKAVYLGEPHRPFYEAMPELPWVALPPEIRHSWTLRSIKRRVRDRFDLPLARDQAREELTSARAFDKILVNSLFTRESVLRAYGLNSEVCYLGIDTDLFRNTNLPRERFVIGLGTIGPTKNVRLAIESIGAMREPRPPLIWVGNMTDPVYIEQMTTLAGQLRVDFQPRVLITDDELVNLLNRAACMIYVSRLEPFGLAPLEANACGCPVVAVAEGGIRETIVDGVNGRFASHDPHAIAEILERMVDNREEAAAMGVEASRLVREKWTLSAGTDRIEDALMRTVQAR